MKIGDIIVTKPLFSNLGFIERFVCKKIFKICKGVTHVGIVKGKDKIVDLDLQGVKVKSLREFLKNRIVVKIIPMNASFSQKIKIHYLIWKHRKVQYNKRHLLRMFFWLRKGIKNIIEPKDISKYFVCSTFAAFLLQRAGILKLKKFFGLFTPASFLVIGGN